MDKQDFAPIIFRRDPSKNELKKKGLLGVKLKDAHIKHNQKSKDILGDNPHAPKTVSFELRKQITDARVKKGFTQKELAGMLCVKQMAE